MQKWSTYSSRCWGVVFVERSWNLFFIDRRSCTIRIFYWNSHWNLLLNQASPLERFETHLQIVDLFSDWSSFDRTLLFNH
jgi:hypothetical protein